MSSARTSSSQSSELFRKENYRFENSATGLDDDSNDIFSSTMKDPQDILSFFSDECEIDNLDSLKKNKNPQNRPAKFTITAYKDIGKDNLSDFEVTNLIDGNHKNIYIGATQYKLKAQQNQVQPVDKGFCVKVSKEGSDQQQKTIYWNLVNYPKMTPPNRRRFGVITRHQIWKMVKCPAKILMPLLI